MACIKNLTHEELSLELSQNFIHLQHTAKSKMIAFNVLYVFNIFLYFEQGREQACFCNNILKIGFKQHYETENNRETQIIHKQAAQQRDTSTKAWASFTLFKVINTGS